MKVNSLKSESSHAEQAVAYTHFLCIIFQKISISIIKKTGICCINDVNVIASAQVLDEDETLGIRTFFNTRELEASRDMH